MTNIPDGEKWLWSPAQPDRIVKRQIIALQQLPELVRRVAELERKLQETDPSSESPTRTEV
jgi:UDP-3-O-[3-hydroxymyristoyl] glucosamine N-acyltransferase